MAKQKKKPGKKRSYSPRRSPEQQIADLEARITELRTLVKDRQQFSPEMVASDRARLELSAGEYAELVGVSMITIYAWENGRSMPRAEQLEKWLAVKGMSKKAAWDALGIEEATEFSPDAVRAERERLGLSAADYAKLVGVSMLTIYNWEWDKSQPRPQALEKWLKVRGISKRDALKRLGKSA